jgi:hypothetical protein
MQIVHAPPVSAKMVNVHTRGHPLPREMLIAQPVRS